LQSFQNSIARINAEMNALLKQSEIRELLEKQGMAPAGGTLVAPEAPIMGRVKS
jgi:hypothetical protein